VIDVVPVVRIGDRYRVSPVAITSSSSPNIEEYGRHQRDNAYEDYHPNHYKEVKGKP
jgi:hypothetical protein